MINAEIKEKIRLAIQADRKPKQGKKSGDWLHRFGGKGYKYL